MSLFVHGLCACLALGSYIPPEAPDRQSGRTTISLQCIAMQQESETAAEAVFLLPKPVLRDEQPLATSPLSAPETAPQPKQRIKIAVIVSTVDVDLPPVPQVTLDLTTRRTQEPRALPSQPETSLAATRRLFPPLETSAVIKAESVPTESQRTLVSQQSSGTEVPPTFARRPEPIYPPELLVNGVEGSVQLLVRVGSTGKPDSVSVHRSSGYRQMDQSALDAVLDWEFSPARIGLTPIAKDVIVPVHFRIQR